MAAIKLPRLQQKVIAMNIEQRKALAHVLSNVKLRRAMKKLRSKPASFAVSALFVGSMLSGCVVASPEGFRLTASLGAEQVQEHTESYTVHDKTPCGGLRAWITGCGESAVPTQREVVRGS